MKRFVAALMLVSGLVGLNLESFAADGTPDTTFSTNIGSGFNNYVTGVAVQSDGKIVVGGYFTSINGTASNRIARLNVPPTPTAQAIPSLSEWAQMLLALMVMTVICWHWNRERSY